jgi:hypothetical protein
LIKKVVITFLIIFLFLNLNLSYKIMISIFGQKTNGGKIETIKDLNDIEDNESDKNHLKIYAIKGRPQVSFFFNFVENNTLL